MRQRQKRSQVARACESCRIHRIKCDDNVPCSNCSTRGRQCSNNDATKVSTLSQAHDEIGRLKSKVKQLEAELQRERDNIQQLTPPSSSPSSTSKYGRCDTHGQEPKQTPWEGILLRPARSPHESWFGPSSLYFFIHRLSVYLSTTLQQLHSTNNMLPHSASSAKLLERPAVDPEDLAQRVALSSGDLASPEVFLTPVQEEYFMNFYWETYHTSVFPIVEEAAFKKHYQSLWTGSGNARRPSALVDIIIAMCMQFGISTLPSDRQGSVAENNDATIAGRWHYRRAQMLLALESESPNIFTLQCHVLCVLYLCGGSFHNMVDVACGQAVRTAYILGLHLKGPPEMPEHERQMRSRLWWAVCLLDSKVGMKLGRPFLLRDNCVWPDLPSDSVDTALISGSTLAPIGHNTTWLSFNLHQTTLYMKVRAGHNAFYGKDLTVHAGQTIWDNVQILEEYADTLTPHTRELDEWAVNVPGALKTGRQNGGRAFSADDSALDVEQFAPMWLQRQRVLLELTYHHLCVGLYRPFISFASIPHTGSMAEENATRCVSHAIALSKITHQILSSTPILNGWHESFQWQWGATMTLLGYLLIYPQGSSASAARHAIELSFTVFDIFGASFAVAVGAANIARDICGKVDFLIAQNQAQGVTSGTAGSANDTLASTGLSNNDQGDVFGPEFWMDGLSGTSTDAQTQFEGMGSDLFDMALDVEFWADMDTLWPGPGNVQHPGPLII
ncbi:putative Fungal-specific transcription factor domain-containing protein [Seiridium cardinale]